MSLDFRLLFAYNKIVSLKLYLVSCDLIARGRLRFAPRPPAHLRSAARAGQSVGAAQHPHRGRVEEHPEGISFTKATALWSTEVGAERASRRALSNLTEL